MLSMNSMKNHGRTRETRRSVDAAIETPGFWHRPARDSERARLPPSRHAGVSLYRGEAESLGYYGGEVGNVVVNPLPTDAHPGARKLVEEAKIGFDSR
jgi:hypothetical protein